MTLEDKKDTCIHCNQEYEADFLKDGYRSIKLCDPCLAKTKVDSSPLYKLFRRLEKRRDNYYMASYVLDNEYRELIEEQKTDARKRLDALREDHERENGVIFFGHRWRPEGFVGDDPNWDGEYPKILFGLEVQPVLVKPDLKSEDTE